ncbi:MAG: glycosyltransferase [Desulfovibrionaceae bacterium]|nr:glycosyltransferase [Desulfovibrionaceae bacterium]
MNFDWRELPGDILAKLCLGGCGRLHLAGMARDALALVQKKAPKGAALLDLARDMLCAAWEHEPLDGGLAAQVLSVSAGQTPCPGLSLALEAVSKAWGPPCPRLARILGRQDPEAALELLRAELDREALNLRHLQALCGLALAQGRPAEAAAYFQGPWPGALEPVRLMVAADLCAHAGDFERALDLYSGAAQTLPLAGINEKKGLCRHRLGHRDQALARWLAALKSRPWNVNLVFRAFDLARGLDRETVVLKGGVSVLVYSHEKARDLERCLAALGRSDLSGVRIVVLDNGSRDDTPRVLDAWEARLGPEVLGRIVLPVNIGAPAARNWLISLPEVRQRPWAAFVDDDALVPPDWLARLGLAVREYPEASVWGCKVVDAAAKSVIQCADLQPRPEYASGSQDQDPGPVTDLHLQVMDLGQFDYLRPCVSVTGCCHLFRTSDLVRDGGFDIGLSPSQFDDLDRDLRLALAGKTAAYQGHLAVGHLKRTGRANRRDPVGAANARANLFKLKKRYGPEEMSRIRARAELSLMRDLSAKSGVLGDLGGSAALRPEGG